MCLSAARPPVITNHRSGVPLCLPEGMRVWKCLKRSLRCFSNIAKKQWQSVDEAPANIWTKCNCAACAIEFAVLFLIHLEITCSSFNKMNYRPGRLTFVGLLKDRYMRCFCLLNSNWSNKASQMIISTTNETKQCDFWPEAAQSVAWVTSFVERR